MKESYLSYINLLKTPCLLVLIVLCFVSCSNYKKNDNKGIRVYRYNLTNITDIPDSNDVNNYYELNLNSTKGLHKILNRFNFDRSYSLIISLFLVIIYSIVTMLLLLILILFNRNRLERKAKINQFLKEKYQGALIDFLYKEDEDKNETRLKLKSIAGNLYNKQFLINEIIDLSINLKGEIASRLRQLYFDLELDKVTYKNVYNHKWHLKIKGFRELAFMGIKNANEEIEKALHSKNDILRMEAQIALVRLNDHEPFNFLNILEKPFSLWEQMNIHELMIYHDLISPKFVNWINSKNKTIAIFAINMIRDFKQAETFEEVVKLLKHSDPEIRKFTIRCLGSFKTPEVLNPLKSHFTEEIYENKMEILKALQVSTDGSNIPFLKWVLENENDVFIQIEAAKAIRNIGERGENELNELVKSDDYRNYQIILLHVLDKRI